MPPAPSSTCTRTEFLHLGVKAFTAAALLSAFPAGTASAATSATAPTTNPTYDLTHFVRWITEEFEPMFRLPGPAGSYAREPGATVTELYGVADMACILYTIGHLHPTEAERAQWIANLQSFQNPDTGYLVEKKPTHAPLHNTAFALAALELFSAGPLHPLKFAADFQDIRTFLLTKLDWKKRVYVDSHRGAGIGAIYALSPDLRSPEWFGDYFAACDSLFDPAIGLMGRDKPPTGDSDQVGGTFHYHFLYEHFNRRMPYPEHRIDTVIGLQQSDGYWAAGNHLWLTLDAIYLLTRTARHCPYRMDDIRQTIRKTLDALMTDVYTPPGLTRTITGHLAVHLVTAAISIAAEAQQFLGDEEIKTPWPLHLVLDRRPFI